MGLTGVDGVWASWLRAVSEAPVGLLSVGESSPSTSASTVQYVTRSEASHEGRDRCLVCAARRCWENHPGELEE